MRGIHVDKAPMHAINPKNNDPIQLNTVERVIPKV